MAVLKITLPQALRDFVDVQIERAGFSTRSAYLRELIRRDLDREIMRRSLLAGVASESTEPVNAAYFDALRSRSAAKLD